MSASQIIFYIIVFLTMYVQVFLLITFIERRKHIVRRNDKVPDLSDFPTVSVIVPCWNEENTIEKTAESLLGLDYPKDKLKILLVDDGSTDKTWEVMQKYKDYEQVEIIHKQNGGKHTALNVGLERAKSDFIACLDADSFVESDALKRLMKYFDDPKVMAVAPSAIVYKPKTIVQNAQRIEYQMAVFNKKMLGFLGGLHVTPGTLPVYRKEVFEQIGPFKKAYNTEDGEIALRMHTHHMKIEYCPESVVYTMSPTSVPALYKQRLRWMYGFLRNVIDYKHLLFKRKYGNLGFFTLPSGLISIMAAIYLFFILLYNVIDFIVKKVEYYRIVGFNWDSLFSGFNFDWFFVSTKLVVFIIIILYTLLVIAMVLGRYITEGKMKVSLHIITYIMLYSVIAPFWLMKAVYNVILSRQSSWR